jgi:hypothetical protein
MASFFRNVRSLLLSVPWILCLSACSDGGTDTKDELLPLVGTWQAQELIMISKVNPDHTWELREYDATFSLSILGSGQYSAVLSAYGQSNTEVGTISVSGNQLTITPTSPPGPSVEATWRLDGNTLILDGDSEFDFNLDGEPEPVTVHFELVRTDD